MTAPVSFREKVRFFSLAPRAPSIHGTQCERRNVRVHDRLGVPSTQLLSPGTILCYYLVRDGVEIFSHILRLSRGIQDIVVDALD